MKKWKMWMYCAIKCLMDNDLNQRIRLIRESEIPAMESPGHPMDYIASGHYHTMIFRYVVLLNEVRGKEVLDTGCGLGWGSFILANTASVVVGVDMDREALSYAKDNWKSKNLVFRHMDITSMRDIQDGSVDIVTSMEVVEHLTNPDGIKYMRECYRVLKPGGYIYGTSGFTDDEHHVKGMMDRCSDHAYIYSGEEFRTMLEDLGYVDVNVNDNWFFSAGKPDG